MHSQVVIIVTVVAVIVATFVFVAMWISRYVKVGPNEVLIVSGQKVRLPDGRTVGYRIVKAGGTFVWPILEKVDVLSLEVRVIDMPECRAGTAEGRPVKLDCIGQVKIKGDDASIVAAAEHFLSKNEADLKQTVRLALEEHLRVTVRGVNFDAIGQSLDVLSARVQAAAFNDLERMGLDVISFTIRSVSGG